MRVDWFRRTGTPACPLSLGTVDAGRQECLSYKPVADSLHGIAEPAGLGLPEPPEEPASPAIIFAATPRLIGAVQDAAILQA